MNSSYASVTLTEASELAGLGAGLGWGAEGRSGAAKREGRATDGPMRDALLAEDESASSTLGARLGVGMLSGSFTLRFLAAGLGRGGCGLLRTSREVGTRKVVASVAADSLAFEDMVVEADADDDAEGVFADVVGEADEAGSDEGEVDGGVAPGSGNVTGCFCGGAPGNGSTTGGLLAGCASNSRSGSSGSTGRRAGMGSCRDTCGTKHALES